MPKSRCWTPDEIEYLQSIARSDEITSIAAKFRNHAAKMGWPPRNENAVRVKLKRLKISFKPLDDGWTCTGLSEILGISRDRVHDWIVRGLLKSSRKPGKRHHRILIQNFVTFAKAHPEWLTDIDRSGLDYLLPPKIVDRILGQKCRTRGIKFAVRANTGKVYSSLREAARSEYFTKGHIKNLAITGKQSREGIGFEPMQTKPHL